MGKFSKKKRGQRIRDSKSKIVAEEVVYFTKYEPAFVVATPKTDKVFRRNYIPRDLTATKNLPTPVKLCQVQVSPDMLDRELQAQAIATSRKKMVAPLYNKGAYQYIGDAPPEIIKTLGRKV